MIASIEQEAPEKTIMVMNSSIIVVEWKNRNMLFSGNSIKRHANQLSLLDRRFFIYLTTKTLRPAIHRDATDLIVLFLLMSTDE